METTVYTSYEDIDRDLAILKLQKEIDLKKLSLSVEKTVDRFTPNNMIMNVVENVGSSITKFGLLQKFVLPFIMRKFVK
nr:DUF6327 family protein [uncultured Flavobacterium sp.]